VSRSALVAVDNFFQATVGSNKNPTLASMFDPANSAPSGPVTTRAFTAANSFSNSLRLEEFTGPTGTNSNGFANNSNHLSAYFHRNVPGNEHDQAYFTGQIGWTGATASSNTYFQSNCASSGSGWYATLLFEGGPPQEVAYSFAAHLLVHVAPVPGPQPEHVVGSSDRQLQPAPLG
jgi:hypothetical protein